MATFSDQDRESALKAHNKARADVNLPALTYDHDLASHAQSYAQQLARTGTFQHHPQRIQGENLFMGFGQTFGVANGTKYWIDEKRHIKNGRATGDVGHYTEIIYPPVTKVGFGLAQGHKGTYVVARYDKIQDSNWTRQALTLKIKPSSSDSSQTQEQQHHQQQSGGFPGGQGGVQFQQTGGHGHHGAHGGHEGRGGYGGHRGHQHKHQNQQQQQQQDQTPSVPWYSGTQMPTDGYRNPGHGESQQRQGGYAEFLRRLKNNVSSPQRPNQTGMGGRGRGCADCISCSKCPDRKRNSR